MSAPASGRKTPVDYGVQIRFIKDLHDTGGGAGGQSRRDRAKSPSRYGVAVRVQGIAGQPYVVLKEGEKGDSYGVQLRSQPPSYNSLPRRKEDAGDQGQYVSAEGSPLRRAQSHGSLLDREESSSDFSRNLGRPPGDGRSGSYGNLDAGIGVRDAVGAGKGTERNRWEGLNQAPFRSVHEGEPERGRNNHYASSESSSDAVITPYDKRSTTRLAPSPNFQTSSTKFDGGGSSAGQSGSMGSSSRGSSPGLGLGNRPNTASSTLSSTPSVALNASYSPRSASPASAYSSLGRPSESVAKVTAVPPSGPANDWSTVDAHVTPDLLMDQGQSSGSEITTEEDQMQHIIYEVLRKGSSETDATIKRRVRVICDKIHGMQVNKPDSALKEQLEQCRDSNVHLQEQLGRKKNELDQTHSELTQLRMDRERAESRVRQLEDQLAGMQEELRRETDSRAQNDTVQSELLALRADLAEAAVGHQKLEDTLRQRERELTALKGALKEEVSTHDREMEALREQYSQDMERLRASMEQVSQSQASIETERQRVNSTVRSLQQQLEESKEEGGHWKEQFQGVREELRNTKQELLQARLEKEEFEEELKELQDKLNTMKKQLPDVKQTETLTQELERCQADLKRARAEVDKVKGDLDKKTMEIISLKKSNQELEAEQKYEIDRLKNQSRKDKEELNKIHEKSKQLADPSLVESLRGELKLAHAEAERLRSLLLSAEEDVQKERDKLGSSQTNLHALTQEREELEATNTRLKEKMSRLEAQLQERVSQNVEAEQELQMESRRLRQQLDETKRGSSKLSQERDELNRLLEERDRERDALRKENTQLEDLKRQHERTLDKLNKEVERLSADSSQSVQLLQSQLEEQKEKWRKEHQDLQKSNKERSSEVEKSQSTIRSLQEELSRHKKELMSCSEERDNAVLDKELLTNRIRHLESELESQRGVFNDRARDVRSLEDKVKHLELELDEEKSSVELMTDRINRSRDQIEQLRSELMQERSSKQDLELDKCALERQLKEYKSRVLEMEGQSRSSAGVSQMESKVQEMEDRLRAEEREKNSALSSQRRLERKLKELNLTIEEERQQLSEQRDQLALRVKALKRQVDESEGEVERLEGLRRKAVRDMEEQMEQKEALQARTVALENELKRKIQQARHISVDSSVLSSEEDDDESLFDHSSITSILTESNLQTSSC